MSLLCAEGMISPKALHAYQTSNFYELESCRLLQKRKRISVSSLQVESRDYNFYPGSGLLASGEMTCHVNTVGWISKMAKGTINLTMQPFSKGLRLGVWTFVTGLISDPDGAQGSCTNY